MLTQSQIQNKYVKHWKLWINRNKKFTPDELEELETFLLDKIEDLQETKKLSDKEAFLQALDIMGEQGMLDEEFGKIRSSKFKKVMLWVFVQTFVILGLVIIIVLPYILIPINTIAGKMIGSIVQWSKEMPEYGIQNIVTTDDGFLFKNPYDNNIYSFEKMQIHPFPIYKLIGTYFSSSTTLYPDFNKTSLSIFDIDSQDRIYCFNYTTYMINIYYKGLLEKSISLAYLRYDRQGFLALLDLKVINNKLVVISVVSNGKKTTYKERIAEKADSYLEVYDLDSKLKLLDKILIKNPLSIDRSKNVIAILSITGEITTYSIQNDKLKLQKEWKIENVSSYKFLNPVIFSFSYLGPSISMLFSEQNNQIVIKDNKQQNSYYYLIPNKYRSFSLIPILDKKVTGIIKINYLNEERLVLVIKDRKASKDGYDNLYLFKE